MPTFRTSRRVRHSAQHMFDLVADVERYPEFLPWCVATRISNVREDGFLAEMVIGFKMFRERYVSRVDLDKPRRIDVSHFKGPFTHLRNHWIFEPAEGGCLVDFSVDFGFRSQLMDRLIGAVFHEAVRRMVSAFERRAAQLYPRLPAATPADLLSGD